MKLLIAGSRNIKEYDVKKYITDAVTLIICGGAVGVDSLAEQAADELGISKLVLRPEYKKYGKAAPLIRNREMVEMADEVVVIWDGISRGAKYTAKYAKEKNKKITLINITETSDI